jgi:NADH:ubiquinone oxidoreductase subunit E
MSGCAVKPASVQPAGLTVEAVRTRMARFQPQIDELWRRYPTQRAVLLQVLHLAQEEYGWVPRATIEWAAEVSKCSPAHAFSVVEFYTMYRQVPTGRHLIQVCQTMCCYIQGSEDLIAKLESSLGIHCGETTSDGLFSLVRVECLALCGSGPGVMIDDQAIGPAPHRLGDAVLRESWMDTADFHPDAACLGRWIDFLRAEAVKDGWTAAKVASGAMPFQTHSAVGDLVLNTKGHPQGVGASAKVLSATYAPPAPALNVKTAVAGNAITVSWINDPLAAKLIVEKSTDGGATWVSLSVVGPKDQKAADTLAEGVSAHYRVIAHEKEREARPSAVVSATGAAPLPPAAPAPAAPVKA